MNRKRIVQIPLTNVIENMVNILLWGGVLLKMTENIEKTTKNFGLAYLVMQSSYINTPFGL
jgi:hypothetical protein